MMTDQIEGDNCTPYNKFNGSSSYKELLDSAYNQSAFKFHPQPLLAIQTSSTRQLLNIYDVCPFRLPARVTTSPRHQNISSFQPSLQPLCILDAPELRNDFYINLIDWGANGILAIALNQDVHLYNPETGAIETIHACQHPMDYVTSVVWTMETTNSRSNACSLFIGTFHSELQHWDIEAMAKIRTLRSHSQQVTSLSWGTHGILASGSQDATIQLHDTRCAQHRLQVMDRRNGEICGLSWSPDGSILASGSTTNELCMWDSAMIRFHRQSELKLPRSTHLEHCAPIRALAWSPWERLVLASGGGTADSTIKLWRMASDKLIRSVSTGAHVCAILWSKTTPQLLSAHEYGSCRSEFTIWSDLKMKRVHEFTSHFARVLHVAMSPDGATVATAGADESLRFWSLFPSTSGQSNGYHTELESLLSVIR
ncbi:hypothetical protein CCR75_000843 [Bremia lactucae]|uniref:CDC20/Fizzy WD40 domain-containing protein n=1 Tax=Bremia lactucae TaxID=4779 RepID=A0A976FNE3_BRELC|nr:hypothetical protein CCR75_005620 [Bremia lactucae]TDH69978.1 hypothetical protein CCR75_000843 [Bremia lactucae]